MRTITCLGLIVLYDFVHSANLRVDPLVLINQGLVRGVKSSNGDYSIFLGIPYGQVNPENPFGAALPAEHFKEAIFEATNGQIICPQMAKKRHRGEALDCLRVNIYVPSSASTTNPLPVMVWVHGGGFQTGYGTQYYPKDLVKKGIVVVTLNYRLGPYGFMCLNTPNVPGNQGLKDQYLALQWVRDNIASFGGNPYQVTLAGHSAGSISVLAHLYSSKDKLYKQIIAQSGTPQVGVGFIEGDINVANKLALHLGFNASDTESALQFLTTTSPDLVTGASVELGLNIQPCIEKSFSGVDNFIETDSYSLSNPKKVKNTPIMIGHTSMEVAFNMAYQILPENYFESDPFSRHLRDKFNFDDDMLQEATDIVRHFYIGDTVPSEDNKINMEEFESDFSFNHPIQDAITNLVKENANPIYEYMFSYIGSTDRTGAPHCEELSYLFEELEKYPKIGDENDDLISDRMTALWSNFVKYGNPTPEETSIFPIWKPVGNNGRPYLNIDNKTKMADRVFHDRMAFWDLFEKLYGKHNIHAQECTR